jgi:hypothetical protein
MIIWRMTISCSGIGAGRSVWLATPGASEWFLTTFLSAKITGKERNPVAALLVLPELIHPQSMESMMRHSRYENRNEGRGRHADEQPRDARGRFRDEWDDRHRDSGRSGFGQYGHPEEDYRRSGEPGHDYYGQSSGYYGEGQTRGGRGMGTGYYGEGQYGGGRGMTGGYWGEGQYGGGGDPYATQLGGRGGWSGGQRGTGGGGYWGGEAGGREWQHGGEGGMAGRSHFDDDYSHWRQEQMRKFDKDYEEWRSERRKKFSEDFDTWRAARPQQGTEEKSRNK